MPLTADEADELSKIRARRNLIRMSTVGAIMFFAFLVLAFLLQQQQAETRSILEQQAAAARITCEQRRANTLRANATWDAMTEIERRNPDIDEATRAARIRTYQAAKPEVPVCAP